MFPTHLPNLGQFNAHKFRFIILNKHPLERRITLNKQTNKSFCPVEVQPYRTKLQRYFLYLSLSPFLISSSFFLLSGTTEEPLKPIAREHGRDVPRSLRKLK